MSSKWNDCSALLCSASVFCMEWNCLLNSVKCITVLRINKRYLWLSKPVRLPASTHPTIIIATNIHINSFGSMYQTRQYICTWWTDGKSYAQCEQKKLTTTENTKSFTYSNGVYSKPKLLWTNHHRHQQRSPTTNCTISSSKASRVVTQYHNVGPKNW